MTHHTVLPDPMPPHAGPAFGAHPGRLAGQDGTVFSVWAPHASGLAVCLFGTDAHPTGERRVALAPDGDGAWRAFVPGVGPGERYGLRADGPWQPEAGHRFNPARLLLDPWALALTGDTTRLALETGHRCADPLTPSCAWQAHQPDPNDNAARMPRCVVIDVAAELAAGRAIAPAPPVPAGRVLVYEAHVKALTRQHPGVPEHQRGTYAALAHPAVIDHLQRLGVTTVCLLPVHQHISERHLLARGLVNHWGYNTLNAFAPEPSYAAATGGHDPATAAQAAAVRAECRQAVDALHRAGIEVVLDVVFNHTCESDLDGPTLSWRGLGQTDWYAMAPGGVPHNFTGTGNSLASSRPRVLQWVLDSLRWWVQAYGVDGFRFDLATTLARDGVLDHGFNPHHPLLSAMAQDPSLRHVRLIAEPWDIGPGGHRTGGFPPGWLEWNDAFRDQVRAFWLGHPGSRSELATRQCASADRFAAGPRSPLASVNFLTAHDGFTLADLTAYAHKHNHANGEDNRDGHSHNLSANAGVEGPSDDPHVQARRGQWRRALLATLLCAQGTPQLLAGDEIGHSQQGNNNAYCQDNPLTWLDWARADTELAVFTGGLAALRRRHPGLRHTQRFTGRPPAPGQPPDIVWHDVDGQPPSSAAWNSTEHRTLTAVICVGEHGEAPTERLLLVWHPGDGPVSLTLPSGPWQHVLDSAAARVSLDEAPLAEGQLILHAPGLHLLVQGLHGSGPAPTPPAP
ncbi:glycogen debranching protein GlgX [Hydrogenophaga electricum]|uniref:Glycogen operon protein GlgX homolog n=1 Tax=Hydrogenophaga electricum TaxID=1230953 RepID=A0ABQ6C3B8_9BURK|nr:glycogen debranching protein GlgX [Hydrogenophaga electricum]GLS14108.1 glycogen operon protein GlgX homolog [Hydrogenophaga electricum]